MRNRSCRNRDRTADRTAGFTLLELLVALSVTGLIAALLLNGLTFGVRAVDRGEERAEQIRELALSQSFLRELLTRAIPLTYEDRRAGVPPTVEFDGDRTKVSFIAPAPAHLGSGGLRRFTLEVISDATTKRMLVSQRLYRPEEPDPGIAGGEEDVELTANNNEIELSYFGSDEKTQQRGWLDHWTGRDTLPSLIRIRSPSRDNGAGNWPDLVIAPRLGGSPGCRYDRTTKRCV